MITKEFYQEIIDKLCLCMPKTKLLNIKVPSMFESKILC